MREYLFGKPDKHPETGGMKVSRRTLSAAGIALFFALVSGGSALAQQEQDPDRIVDPRPEQRTYIFEETGEELPYAVYVSSKADPEEASPLVVALHGLGGDQNSMIRTVRRTVDFVEDEGYILVAPMGYNSGGWYGIPPRQNAGNGGGRGGAASSAVTDPARVRELSELGVMTVLAMIEEEFNIDPNRIYLMGHSMGGAGALYLGVKHSSRWAALAPIAPAAFSLDPDSLASIPDMPVILVQGDADTAVPVENTRRWAAKLEELDMTHEYLEIPGGDHGNLIGIGMPDIFAFFERHTKASRTR